MPMEVESISQAERCGNVQAACLTMHIAAVHAACGSQVQQVRVVVMSIGCLLTGLQGGRDACRALDHQTYVQ